MNTFLETKNQTDSHLLSELLTGEQEQKERLTQQIFSSCENNLNKLASSSIESLLSIEGMTLENAQRIVFVFELGRRKEDETVNKEITSINSSRASFNLLQPILSHLNHEEFWIIVLDRANQVLRKIQLSKGGSSGAIVDGKILFRTVLAIDKAAAIIIAHNHPSGNLTPSQADKHLTAKIRTFAEHVDLKLLDHIIVGGNKYFSFLDEGLM